VRIDPTDSRTAYVTFSGYRYDTFLPHIFGTTNLGSTWQDISSNLPEAPINVVLVDPLYPSRLYVGTDVGCYFSTNSGAEWQPMGSGLPNVAVSDMQIHGPTRIARAFTHGRSMWEINLDELVTGAPEMAGQPVEFALDQNYPNPFNGETRIRFRVLGTGSRVQVRVYDVRGRLVVSVVDGILPPGEHVVTFGASGLGSGVYFCRLESGGFRHVRKMILLR
jgi:hypothetical protein